MKLLREPVQRALRAACVALDVDLPVRRSRPSRDSTDLALAHAAFKANEARYHHIFDSMLEGCQILDREFRYLYVNESVLRHARKTRDDLIGERMVDVYPGIEHTELYETLARCMSDRSAHRFQNRFDHPDGAVAWYDLSIQPTPEGVFILSFDITEQKRAEVTLQASEERYRTMVESAHEGIWQIDQVGRTTFVNPRMAELLGYTVEEMLGTMLFTFMPESERIKAADNMERRRRGIAEQHDFLYLRKDGSTIWTSISTNPVRDADGNYVGAMALVTDLSERKRAEAALQESNARFKQLAESLPHLIWTCSADGACEFLNQQWESFTGRPTTALLPSGWLEVVHPDERDGMRRRFARAVKRGEPVRAEYRLRRHSGEYRWFEVRAEQCRDDHGKLLRWVGVCTDVDDRRQNEASRVQAQKMEALGTLAGGIAHDFNNLLMAIQGNAGLLASELGPANPAQERVREIERAGGRASELVRRILTFSRQEAPKRETLDLAPIMNEAVQLLRASLPAKIALRTAYGEHVPPVAADSTQILQILMNLSTNAAHAIGAEAGAITLALDAVEAGPELCRITAGLTPGHYARITVTDDGRGMDASTVGRIFDPFFTTKPVGQGTGLGLSVVDGIVKTHRGAISVHSEPERGSVFRLYLPATADERSKPKSAPPVLQTHAQGEAVLYVDDDPAVVVLGVLGLKKLGYDVTGCADPVEALERFRGEPDRYAAVITDYSMPRLTGTELAQELLRIRPQLPIMITSGFLVPEQQRAALAMGVRSVHMKPTSIAELARALKAHLYSEVERAV